MNAVLVWLCRSTQESVANLLRSMDFASRNFLRWSPADILVFHEDGFDEDAVRRGAKTLNLPGNLRFAKVDFSAVKPGFENLAQQARGYRHMCHFFGDDIFNRAELSCYDYFMRLDDDSYILSQIKFNVFDKMSKEGIKYSYRFEMTENKNVCQGLLETAQAFIDANPHLNRTGARPKKVKLYYTNFEICDLKWFQSEPWKKYFEAIDAANGIWTNRWGDAPIRWLGLQYLLVPKEILPLKWMAYQHQFRLRRGFMSRLPLEYIRYALTIVIYNVKNLIWNWKHSHTGTI